MSVIKSFKNKFSIFFELILFLCKTLVDDTHDRNYDLNIYDDLIRDFITIRTIYIYIILSKLFMIYKL